MGLRQSVSCLDQQLDQQQQWLVGGVLSLSFLWYLSTRTPHDLPPCPGRGLPFIGHMYQVEKDPRFQFKFWRKRLGDVFSLYMGPRLVVVLNGMPSITEAIVFNQKVFSDRPHPARRFRHESSSSGQGLMSSSGKEWLEQRTATQSILRQMSMLSNNIVGDKIQAEADKLVQTLYERRDGFPFDLRPLTQSTVTNMLWSIIFGQPEDPDNTFFSFFKDALHQHFQQVSESSSIIHFLPSLCTNPPDVSLLKRPEAVIQTLKALRTYIAEKLSAALHNDPSRTHSFIGAYVEKSEELEESQSNFLTKIDMESSSSNWKFDPSDSENPLNEINLRRVVFDMFIGGAESTTIILQWLVLIFLHYPELQERCYIDIIRATGGRTATMADRDEMVYVQATIMEALRYCDILPLGVPHGLTAKTMFRDYALPKESTIAVNLNSVLKDYRIWGDPDRFRPERFINLEGKLEQPPEFIPFGLGKRACVGSNIAQAALFLCTCSLVQRYRFIPEKFYYAPALHGQQGVFNNPPDFKLRVIPRDTPIN